MAFNPTENNASMIKSLEVLNNGIPPYIIKVDVKKIKGYISPKSTFMVTFSERLRETP